MEIAGRKEREYLRKLLVENPSNSFVGNLKKVTSRFFTDPDTFRGKRGLAEYLTGDSTKSLSHAYRFIDKLEEHGCLTVVDEELTGSRPVDVITVDKAAVRAAVYESAMYEREKPLWRHLLNKAGDT